MLTFPYFLRQSLVLASGLLSKLGWLTSEPQGHTCLSLPFTGTQFTRLCLIWLHLPLELILKAFPVHQALHMATRIKLRIQVPNSKHKIHNRKYTTLIISVQPSTVQHTFIWSSNITKVTFHIYLFGNTRPTGLNLGFATPTGG